MPAYLITTSVITSRPSPPTSLSPKITMSLMLCGRDTILLKHCKCHDININIAFPIPKFKTHWEGVVWVEIVIRSPTLMADCTRGFSASIKNGMWFMHGQYMYMCRWSPLLDCGYHIILVPCTIFSPRYNLIRGDYMDMDDLLYRIL